MYSFNENSTYRLYHGGNKLFTSFKLKFQKIFGLSLPLVLNVVPRRTKITVVIGEPVEMPLMKNPPLAVVDQHLNIYINKLKEMYEANKSKYSEPKDKPLIIL